MSWFQRFRRARPNADAVRNAGLELAMDWGADWLSPIQPRLRALHPHLGAEALDAVDAECQGATRLARETVHRMLAAGASEPSLDRLAPVILGQYPWVEPRNLERLLRHGVYYAAKTGGAARDR